MSEAPETNTSGAEPTTVGNLFISNYPPYSFWSEDAVPELRSVLANPPSAERPLGVYIHIPFCRKRCDFCYFKVYTDKNSKEIRRYLDALKSELGLLAPQPFLAGRPPRFVYFGGGTPSYLSADQIRTLFASVRAELDWSRIEEVTFECEPGTLSRPKIEALAELGVTRLSLGVENFDPHILEINNRAHRADEIHRTYEIARDVGFQSINIDLIAGMIGETDDNWTDCVEKTVALLPESVTIYQMEVPYNTTIYGRMKNEGVDVAPVAGWDTKRRWVTQAFDRLAQAGYHQSSAYTAGRGDETRFVYRDSLWHGADMLGLGVSSFGQLQGVHYQNEHAFEPYVTRVEAGELPVARAFAMSDEERLIRELILQMKTGLVELEPFRQKFGVDVADRFRAPLEEHQRAGHLTYDDSAIRTTREGLMRVDRLLPAFFLEEHRGARYA